MLANDLALLQASLASLAAKLITIEEQRVDTPRLHRPAPGSDEAAPGRQHGGTLPLVFN